MFRRNNAWLVMTGVSRAWEYVNQIKWFLHSTSPPSCTNPWSTTPWWTSWRTPWPHVWTPWSGEPAGTVWEQWSIVSMIESSAWSWWDKENMWKPIKSSLQAANDVILDCLKVAPIDRWPLFTGLLTESETYIWLRLWKAGHIGQPRVFIQMTIIQVWCTSISAI